MIFLTEQIKKKKKKNVDIFELKVSEKSILVLESIAWFCFLSTYFKANQMVAPRYETIQ